MSGESASAKKSLSRRSKSVLIGVGIALGATVISAVAFAAWTITGSGSAAGKAGVAANISISAVVPVGDLYPGVNGTASFAVTNTNNYAVQITQLTFSISGVTMTTDTNAPSAGTACTPADLLPPLNDASNATTWTVSVPAAKPIIVPANSTATSGTYTLANAFSLSSNAPDNCQGATFTITVPSVVASLVSAPTTT